MTTISQGLLAYVLADSTVAALVAARMYPVTAPQNATRPFIVYQMIGGADVHSTDGASGLAFPMFQFTFHGELHSDVDAVFEAVRKRIDGYKGDVGGVAVRGIFLERRYDLPYDPETDSYRRGADFSVWHKEST